MRQKDIAEKVGLSRPRVANIVASGNVQNEQAPDFTNSDLTVTAKLKDELEALRRRLEEAEFARQIWRVKPGVDGGDEEAGGYSSNRYVSVALHTV